MKKMRILLGMLALMGIVFFTGCQDMENVDNDKYGNLVIRITDAPFPVSMIDSAIVAINKVEIRKLSEGEEIEYPFITIWEGYEEFNLLELRNGITAELVDMEIEPGNYDLIRLYVDEARLVVKEGGTFSMKVPSGAQTGIKLFVEPPLQVAGGLTTDVLLDFDIDRSFVLRGNAESPAGIKGFNFKPVIRAVNNTTAGTLEGVVDYSDTLQKDVSVWIHLDTVITTAFTDTFGYYAIPGIPAGIYNVSAAKEGFDTVTVEGVEIMAGNLTVQNFTLEAAAESTTDTEE